MKKIEFIVETTKTGFSAYTKKYPVGTTGKDWKQLTANMVEAMNLYFEDDCIIITQEDLKIVIDIPQFFKRYKAINTKGFSERIGFDNNQFNQYLKGTKKPTALQTQKILKGVQQLGKELAELSFLL